jgi:hypothetical protein
MAATDISDTVCSKGASYYEVLCGVEVVGGIAPGILCTIFNNCPGNDPVGDATAPPGGTPQPQPQQSNNQNLLLYGGLGFGAVVLLVVLLKVMS